MLSAMGQSLFSQTTEGRPALERKSSLWEPMCCDPNVIIHYKNVNLLQQFISPHTGIVYDPTQTGGCMKQKLLNKAIETAIDIGLLPFLLPHVNYSKGVLNTQYETR